MPRPRSRRRPRSTSGPPRRRRAAQAWLAGPTDEERRAYASQLKHRRLSETFDEGEHLLDESVRRGLHYGREGQLAAEGAVSLLYTWSRKNVRRAGQGRARVGGRDGDADPAPSASRSMTTPTDRRSEAVAAHRLDRRAAQRPADRRMRTLFRHPLRVWHVVAVFFRLFIAPALHLPGADHRPRTRPPAPRLRASRRGVGEARPDAGPALRPPAGRLLRRAVRAAQPGRAVQLRRGPRDHPPGARRRARGRVRDVRAPVVRRGVDRAGPPGHAPQRRPWSRSRSSGRTSARP